MKRVKGWRIHFEPEQIAWLERRARAKGRVFIAARRPERPQSFWLFRGIDARELVSVRTTTTMPLVFAAGPPASWPWSAIARALTK